MSSAPDARVLCRDCSLLASHDSLCLSVLNSVKPFGTDDSRLYIRIMSFDDYNIIFFVFATHPVDQKRNLIEFE